MNSTVHLHGTFEEFLSRIKSLRVPQVVKEKNNSNSGKKSSSHASDINNSATAGCYLGRPNQKETKTQEFSTIKAFTKQKV